MKITVVYESMFGNTHQVAQAISDGIREANRNADVQCVSVKDASPELIQSTELLIVGGPTHIRGMTSALSRKMGVKEEQKDEARGEPAHELQEDAEGPGVRAWFKGLPTVKDGRAAAFDTRLEFSLAGGAAGGIARRLRKHGYHVVSDPEGFIVEDAYGPLRAGEIDRAKQWGAQLVPASVNTTTHSGDSKESKTPAVRSDQG